MNFQPPGRVCILMATVIMCNERKVLWSVLCWKWKNWCNDVYVCKIYERVDCHPQNKYYKMVRVSAALIVLNLLVKSIRKLVMVNVVVIGNNKNLMQLMQFTINVILNHSCQNYFLKIGNLWYNSIKWSINIPIFTLAWYSTVRKINFSN